MEVKGQAAKKVSSSFQFNTVTQSQVKATSNGNLGMYV